MLQQPTITPKKLLAWARTGVIASADNANIGLDILRASGRTAPVTLQCLTAIATGILPSVELIDKAQAELTRMESQYVH